jgi:hypothetical protein
MSEAGATTFTGRACVERAGDAYRAVPIAERGS